MYIHNRRGLGHVTHFLKFCPPPTVLSLESVKLGPLKLHVLLDTEY